MPYYTILNIPYITQKSGKNIKTKHSVTFQADGKEDLYGKSLQILTSFPLHLQNAAIRQLLLPKKEWKYKIEEVVTSETVIPFPEESYMRIINIREKPLNLKEDLESISQKIVRKDTIKLKYKIKGDQSSYFGSLVPQNVPVYLCILYDNKKEEIKGKISYREGNIHYLYDWYLTQEEQAYFRKEIWKFLTDNKK